MNASVTHVIVGPANWNPEKIRYRRHRLTEYICNQNSAGKVIWVYPVSATPRMITSYKEAFKLLSAGLIRCNNKLYSLGLPDLIPGRYGKTRRIFSSYYINNLINEVQKLPNKKILWYTTPIYPYLSDILQWDRIVYDCSDLWSAPRGLTDKMFSRFERLEVKKAEEKIVKKSDLIFTTSDYLGKDIKERLKRDAIVIENGVDLDLFKLSSPCHKKVLTDIPKPRLGFIGGMKGKINFNLLKQIADRKPSWSIVLVGPLTSKNIEHNNLLTCRNVHWINKVAPDEIPAYIKSFDVGIMPYKEIEYNNAVFPLKFYEYLAAGIPVVGCGLPSTQKYSSDEVYKHVRTDAFLDACEEIIEAKIEISAIKKRIDLAQKACWSDKFSFIFTKVVEDL